MAWIECSQCHRKRELKFFRLLTPDDPRYEWGSITLEDKCNDCLDPLDPDLYVMTASELFAEVKNLRTGLRAIRAEIDRLKTTRLDEVFILRRALERIAYGPGGEVRIHTIAIEALQKVPQTPMVPCDHSDCRAEPDGKIICKICGMAVNL
jgi:hypothetical protein